MQIYTRLTHHLMRKTLASALLLFTAILPAHAVQFFDTFNFAPNATGVFNFAPNATGVFATASNKNIAINRTASIQVTWNVVTFSPALVSSTEGVLSPLPAGPALLRIPKLLNGKSRLDPTSRKSVFSITEKVLIPASVIARARAAGAIQISYERSFIPAGKGNVVFNITGSASAGFSISREALSFTDK